ncbi:maltose/maltodextrin ABC transporter substrate-binding protein MalE [Reinekea sp.]|jgi:maltose/maltodextrin transport system substrate-binding protein|uniref:maltose/maltodextrin ABC transporter substrate-binding protein MalE n=1 Tax=Reinekea sp. TaxID=1970455 RepID=UPI0039895438
MQLYNKVKASALGLVLIASSQLSYGFQEDALVVWINSDKGYEGLGQIAEQFSAETGIKVIVETQNDWPESYGDPANRFDRVAATSEGPDIIIWAHDRFGNWINEGLLEPVQPSKELYDQIDDFAWNAVTVGNSIYGYPIAMEAISLIYNKDLIPKAPTSWNEVIALDKELRKEGKRAIMWPTNNVYFTWPLLTSAGGYSFKKIERVYQLNEVGVDNRGAVKGLNLLQRLKKEGVIEDGDGVDWGAMMDGFKNGDIAMNINGPWVWNELKTANLNFGLAKFPRVDKDSGLGRPFVGFLSAAINSSSPNTEMAKKLLEEYVVVYDGVKAIDTDRPIGAAANKQLMAELESDAFIAHTYVMAATGETMPDIPEMKRFWSSMEFALADIVNNNASVQSTIDSVGARLRKLDTMKMWSRKHYLTSTSSTSGSN